MIIDPQDRLRSTVRFLGGLLGETIIEQEGQAVFDLEEEIRNLAKLWRAEGDLHSFQDQIDAQMQELMAEPQKML
ncbi:MAG: hypothetical protein KDE19_03110, partial [Caldilineaceae bacterium]|nr:hypothetical protein [Caldilineaceae bacterium]